jgi:hypothetical protein
MGWWWVIKIALILIAGAVGGLANAILIDGGFKKGYRETLGNGQQIWRPGWSGNVFIGMIAGFIFWVLYGNMKITEIAELLQQLVGSVIAGVGGGRLITGEADKRILAASKDELTDALREALKSKKE